MGFAILNFFLHSPSSSVLAFAHGLVTFSVFLDAHRRPKQWSASQLASVAMLSNCTSRLPNNRKFYECVVIGNLNVFCINT